MLENVEIEIENRELEVNADIRESFKVTAKWSKFLAITGFVMLGIMILAVIGYTIAALFTKLEYFTIGVILIYLAMAIIYYFPIMYSFRFAKKTLSALESNEQNEFEAGMQNLASVYKFMGIFMIIMLSFYAVSILFAFSFGLISAFK